MNSCPSSGRITPPTIFPSVDFPAPLAPTSACTVPPATSTLTSSSALVPEYRLPIETSRTGATAVALIRLVLDLSSGSSSISGWLTCLIYSAGERPVWVEARMCRQERLVDDRRAGRGVDDVDQVRRRL